MNVARPVPPAPRASPVRRERLRRLFAVPVALALVLGAPGLAYAAFTAGTNASLSVGTYTIPAPASVNGTLQCTNDRGQKGASITFTSVSAVDRATGYTATLTPPTGAPSLVPIAAGGKVQVTMYSGSGKGKYTFTVSAQVGSWTGPEFKQTAIC